MPDPTTAAEPDQAQAAGVVRVGDPLYGGSFASGPRLALPFVLPQELVEIENQGAPTILEASPHRATPACVHFGACGGCHYQHASYPEQLALKQTVLAGLLSALPALPPIETVASPALAYRNRIRLRIEPTADGTFAAGYSLRGQNDFLPVTMCPIAAPFLWQAATAVLALSRTDPLVARWLAATQELELFTSGPTAAAPATAEHQANTPTAEAPAAAKHQATSQTIDALTAEAPAAAEHHAPGPTAAAPAAAGELEAPGQARLQLHFLLRSAEAAKREASSFAGLCERLVAVLPGLRGASAVLDPDLNRRARRAWAGVSWGADGLSYVAAGRTYWLPRGAFFQVNRFLLDRLVALVTDGVPATPQGTELDPLARDLLAPGMPTRSLPAPAPLPRDTVAWDLYAGVGLFTRALAERFSHVIAVEGAEAAHAGLVAASRAPSQGSSGAIEPVLSATLDFLRAQVHQRERPSLVVLDPPRAGLGAEGSSLLARLAPEQIVYVSCDPTTLARDLSILAGTYDIFSLHLVDLFPQTFHIETVTHLSRKSTRPSATG